MRGCVWRGEENAVCACVLGSVRVCSCKAMMGFHESQRVVVMLHFCVMSPGLKRMKVSEGSADARSLAALRTSQVEVTYSSPAAVYILLLSSNNRALLSLWSFQSDLNLFRSRVCCWLSAAFHINPKSVRVQLSARLGLMWPSVRW